MNWTNIQSKSEHQQLSDLLKFEMFAFQPFSILHPLHWKWSSCTANCKVHFFLLFHFINSVCFPPHLSLTAFQSTYFPVRSYYISLKFIYYTMACNISGNQTTKAEEMTNCLESFMATEFSLHTLWLYRGSFFMFNARFWCATIRCQSVVRLL